MDVRGHQKIGGKAVHVGDSHVWATIFYLDSPTEYREFLPAFVQESRPLNKNLAILDNKTTSIWGQLPVILVIALVIVSIIRGVFLKPDIGYEHMPR